MMRRRKKNTRNDPVAVAVAVLGGWLGVWAGLGVWAWAMAGSWAVLGAVAVLGTVAWAWAVAEVGAWAWAMAGGGALLGAVAGGGVGVVVGAVLGAWVVLGAVAVLKAWTVTEAVTLAVAWVWGRIIRKRRNANRIHRTPSKLLRCLPPDSRAYLYELRKRWRKRGDSKRLIELKTNLFALDMVRGYIQCKLQNLLLPFKKS